MNQYALNSSVKSFSNMTCFTIQWALNGEICRVKKNQILLSIKITCYANFGKLFIIILNLGTNLVNSSRNEMNSFPLYIIIFSLETTEHRLPSQI